MNPPFMDSIRHPFPDPPEVAEPAEVAPGVHWLRLPVPMRPDHVNIYALEDRDDWVIVDTGMWTNRSEAIWQTLTRDVLAGKNVSRVIVTHHHPDHIGMAGWLQTECGAELLTTRTSWLLARMLTLDVQEHWPEETLEFYRRAGMDPAILRKRQGSRPFNFADVVYPMPLGYRRIQDGDTLRIGHRNWRVVLGNGHAPEHATLWSETDRLVLSGDQVLPGISPNLGVYPTEPEADPVGEWLESCSRLLELADSDYLVLPGHKLPFTGLRPRLKQLLEHHRNALERLADRLSRPATAHDCFECLYKRQIGESEYGLALVESMAHLNHLYRMGRINRVMRTEDGAWMWGKRKAPEVDAQV